MKFIKVGGGLVVEGWIELMERDNILHTYTSPRRSSLFSVFCMG